MTASPVNLADELAKAEEKTLQEILRQAGSYLSAQLTAGIAADQRALAFIGVIATASALVAAASIAVMQTGSDLWLAYIGVVVTIGFLVAMRFAMRSAMPTKFWYVGNSPDQWLSDVQENKTWTRSCAEQAASYADMIADNSKLLKENSASMRTAIWICWSTLTTGAVLSFVLAITKFPAAG
jgi:hypothetical protein